MKEFQREQMQPSNSIDFVPDGDIRWNMAKLADFEDQLREGLQEGQMRGPIQLPYPPFRRGDRAIFLKCNGMIHIFHVSPSEDPMDALFKAKSYYGKNKEQSQEGK